MKKILIILTIASSILWMGCSNFLDTKDLTEKTNASFPITADDFDQAVAAIYSAQRDCYFDQINSFMAVSSYLDDDYIANGRSLFNDPWIRAFERYQVRNLDVFLVPWQNYYTGIFRSNFVLESVEKNGSNLTNLQKASVSGQAYYLRASLYFDLCRLFGGVPLKTSTASSNPSRASVDSCFCPNYQRLKKCHRIIAE